MTTIDQQQRRFYLRDLPFEQRGAAKSAGCKWDPNQRAWWTGKRDVAEQVAGSVNSEAAPKSEPGSSPSSDRPPPGEDATVSARATYKGRTYYVAGRVVRGRTHWDDAVSEITTRDRSKVLLYFRDGSKSFWASVDEVQVVKSYRKPTTIGSLKRFAEKAKAAGGADNYLEQRAESSGRCRGCGGPLTNARHHAAMGGYCGSCAFDEFDC